ncbi:hypothetical protein NE857_26840 [Nocardiopsis exhalans]|uniref:Uncharacterized protein n=1 Tax=Nocardiopsis exhalans TaxID=163604 RepID=A0ABY5D7G3_9ACTN|nr:hypothetical protein [Nocardiopsis exhalans]USY18860.1 hypothetical protein NE857_26840 [Nocardiopsis exhalans]
MHEHAITPPNPHGALDGLVDIAELWEEGVRDIAADPDVTHGEAARFATAVALDYAQCSRNEADEGGDTEAGDGFAFFLDYMTLVRAGVLQSDAYADELESLLRRHVRDANMSAAHEACNLSR